MNKETECRQRKAYVAPFVELMSLGTPLLLMTNFSRDLQGDDWGGGDELESELEA